LVICTRVTFAKSAEISTQELRWSYAFVCGSDAGERQADGSRCDMLMSGIVNSRHQSSHNNINAIDPHAKRRRVRFAAAIER
jgi:hypothetical protein